MDAVIKIMVYMIHTPDLFPGFTAEIAPKDILLDLLQRQQDFLKLAVRRISVVAPFQQVWYLQFFNFMLTETNSARAIMRSLDSFGARKAIAGIDVENRTERCYELVLQFQNLVILDYHQGIQQAVRKDIAGQVAAINEIFDLLSVTEHAAGRKWRHVGFQVLFFDRD